MPLSNELELLEEAALDYGTCIITIRDEVYCNIQGLQSFHREALIKIWAIRVDGAFFVPSFQSGSWDGKIKYFKSNGNTYLRILNEIVPWIIDLGYKIQLIDKRKPRNANPEPIDANYFSAFKNKKGRPIILRYYQVDSTNASLEAGEGMLILATGAGKTYINAAIVKRYEEAQGLRSFTIVPNANLVRQTKKFFELVGLDTGSYYGKKKEIDHQHVVGTWQALQNNKDLLKDFQVVIVDEAHGAKAKVLLEMLTEGPGAHIQYRFGMTGTMPKPKSDKLSIKVSLGNEIYNLPAKQLIDEGYLARLDIAIIQLQDSITDQLNWDSEKAFLSRNKKRLAVMADLIKTLAASGNTLILVESVKAGQTLEAFIPGSVFLWGDIDPEDREIEYESFADHDDKIVIASYGIAKVGIDIERVFNLVLIDAGKAFIRAIQGIGRGLRKAADKHEVTVLDLCSNGKYSEKHRKERVRYYKEAKYPFRIEKLEI